MKSYESSSVIRGIWIVCLCFVTVGTANGQRTPTKIAASTRGTLSGRVFAITQGGDLKPARMANVYILFDSGVTRDGKAVDVGETAWFVYENAHHVAQVQYLKDFEANPQWTDKMACMKDLATFHPAMLKAIDWGEAHGK
jgi:hypothetical protein